MVHFEEINQVHSRHSMLQGIGRVATPKLVPRNCLWYLQTTSIMGERGVGLRIYVRYCLKNWMKNKKGLEKTCHFFSLSPLFWMYGICQMVLWLIGLLLDHFDPQKNWSGKIMGRYNGFLSLKVNILSTQSVLFSWHAILLERE